ncbi:MAG: GGDEF domain-containing protein, partial [Candidatus Pacebacteria bacterium]|nr:GGDEF domain-containing protein [Candidatus Paceibacterota bacterium]
YTTIIMRFEGQERRTVEELESELAERDRRIAELEKEAITDSLTGLYNRRGLEKAARIVMPEPNKEGRPEKRDAEQKTKNVAVLDLDIDGFKGINDRYGHLEGDRVIREAGEFLTRSMREYDVVARMGGDEFVVIMNGATERIINKFFDHDADPPRPRFGFTTEIGGEPRRISFSGGITLLQPGETIDNLTDMVGRADEALYESKEAGRDRVTLFKPSANGNIPADKA